MTAILTKQNVLDKALIGGSGGGSGEFDSLHVKGDATIDGEIITNFKEYGQQPLSTMIVDGVGKAISSLDADIKNNRELINKRLGDAEVDENT